MIGAITAPPATSSGVDVEVVIDISGSMSGTDPQFLRKDAMRALLGLVSKGDRLGAVAFDDEFEPVFDLQSVTDANSGALATLADQHILNRGGTDYNVAFTKGYEGLTLPAVYSPARPKYVIFLTDGAHNASDYNNGHLLMAANPTGRPVARVRGAARLAGLPAGGRRRGSSASPPRPAASTRPHDERRAHATRSAAAWAPRRTSARSSTRP